MQCLLWDRGAMAKVVKVAIIFHNMIVELRRDGYGSLLSSLVNSAVARGMVFGQDDGESTFISKKKDKVIVDECTASVCEDHIAEVEEKMKDEVNHLLLKSDLIEHVWYIIDHT